MTNVHSIIERFGGVRPMAKMLMHKNPSTVQSWKNSGRIPYWRRAEIESAAKRQEIKLPVWFSSAKPQEAPQ